MRLVILKELLSFQRFIKFVEAKKEAFTVRTSKNHYILSFLFKIKKVPKMVSTVFGTSCFQINESDFLLLKLFKNR